MSADPVLERFLHHVAEDAVRLSAESDILSLQAYPFSGSPPTHYIVKLEGVPHVRTGAGGRLEITQGAIGVSLCFPRDYCSSLDASLGTRVARVVTPLRHPNVLNGRICLGRLAPATPLRPLLIALYAILSGRSFATRETLDSRAADFYLCHQDELRELERPPLFREPVPVATSRGAR